MSWVTAGGAKAVDGVVTWGEGLGGAREAIAALAMDFSQGFAQLRSTEPSSATSLEVPAEKDDKLAAGTGPRIPRGFGA